MAGIMQKKSLCILLAAAMLLAGVCFEKTKAESFWAYVNGPDGSQALHFLAGDIDRPELCTEELLGGQGLGSVTDEIGHSDKTTNLLAAILLSSAEGFSQNPAIIHQIADWETGCAYSSGAAVIIGYIHQKDGSKG